MSSRTQLNININPDLLKNLKKIALEKNRRLVELINEILTNYIHNKKNDQTKFITFDDSESIKYKCEFAHNQNLGGVMIWALSYDLVEGEQKLIQSIDQNYLSLNHESSDFFPETLSMRSYPNPFNSENTIELDIQSSEKISIQLISLNGRLIGELLNRKLSNGKFYLKWDMKNIYPKPSSGVFFIKATSKNIQTVEKIIYLK